MLKSRLAYLLAALLLLNSCAAIYGIKEARELTETDLQQAEREFGIEVGSSYTLKVDDYLADIKRLYATDSLLVKNYYQPLQLRVYNPDGYLEGLMVNCFAPGGLTKLKWNARGDMDTFPPKNTKLPQGEHLSQLTPFLIDRQTKDDSSKWDQQGYTLVIFWADMLNKQSRLFNKQINKMLQTHGITNYHKVYVNTDGIVSNK